MKKKKDKEEVASTSVNDLGFCVALPSLKRHLNKFKRDKKEKVIQNLTVNGKI